MSSAGEARAEGLIGPNAVTRVAEALAARGEAVRRRVFEAAGLAHRLAVPPEEMVPDADVARLHHALRETLGLAAAIDVGREAGRLTGLYILERRIPPLARRLFPLLPWRVGLRPLLPAIGWHAWTFAGAGRFSWTPHREGAELEIAGGPVSRHAHDADGPVCAYYAAAFETILRAMLRSDIVVAETECEAAGADACRFLVSRA
jgi:divinyl protochlorophyllide a 8-vinyl-reductase